jgi:hypothetical protein
MYERHIEYRVSHYSVAPLTLNSVPRFYEK